MSFITAHHIDDSVLRVSIGQKHVFDYNYRPKTNPLFCPRPYFHPLKNLHGDIVTNNRPSDHPWHQGLSLTLTSLNGMNFWGGPTYLEDEKTYRTIENGGKQIHIDWLEETPSENGYTWVETLEWIGPKGEHVLNEKRTLTVCDIDEETGFWRLLWESELTNTLGKTIEHSTYCSAKGLEGSGYTGLFLRMSRGFDKTPDYIFADDIFKGKKPEWDDYQDGEKVLENVEDLNGWKASKLAYQGIFDTSLNGTLLICEDLTDNPTYEHHWFHRPHYPCLSYSTAFHDTMKIEKGATISFKHALGIANGFWTKDRATNLWSE